MAGIPFTSQVYEKDGRKVAYCPQIDVYGYGDTIDEALSQLEEAVTEFLKKHPEYLPKDE